MKVYDVPLAVIVLIIIPLTAHAEEAVTLSGKRVILHENGMWEYKKTIRVKEVKFRSIPWGSTAEQIKHANLGKPELGPWLSKKFKNLRVVYFDDSMSSVTFHVIITKLLII